MTTHQFLYDARLLRNFQHFKQIFWTQFIHGVRKTTAMPVFRQGVNAVASLKPVFKRSLEVSRRVNFEEAQLSDGSRRVCASGQEQQEASPMLL